MAVSSAHILYIRFEYAAGEVQMENILFYYSYRDLMEELTMLKMAYGNRMKIVSAGFSADKRMIPEIIIGNPNASVHILIQAGIHGREYMNCALVMRQVKEYLEHMISDENNADETERLCYHVLPMTNPDGCMISQYGPAAIRSRNIRRNLMEISGWTEGQEKDICEQRRFFQTWKSNARGVDLNRNFLPGWETSGECDHAGFQGYKGTRACSEPEVKAILGIPQKYPFDCCISYHSSGEVIYWDYGRKKESDKKTSSGKSRSDKRRRERQLAGYVSRSTSYPMVSVREIQAPGAGCADHFAEIFDALAITIETGSGQCPLKYPEYKKICSQNHNLWKELERFCKKR